MKKIKSILVFAAAMMLAAICNATIRIADNNPGAPNDGVHNFSTLAAAYTASVNGDTIYVQGSNTIYPSLTLQKVLTLIGTGFNPASYPPKLNALYSTIANIQFYTACSGSKIIGFRINSINTANNNNVITNISLIRCMFTSNYDHTGSIDDINNWIIEGCLFTNTGIFFLNGCCLTNTSGVIFRNNIISGQINGGNSGYQIYNNIFLNTTNPNYISNGASCNAYNNIFYGQIPTAASGVTFFNNAIYNAGGGSFPGTANVVYTTTAPFFVSAAPGAFSFSNNYQIVAGSPLLTGGVSGAEQGVYGGTSQGAFTMTGFPALPNVLQFTISPNNPTIPQNAALNVNIISKRIQ